MTDPDFPPLFRSARTGEFGLAAHEVATRTGVPMFELYRRSGAMEWQGYHPAPTPPAPLGSEAVEAQPVGGVQQWRLRTVPDGRADELRAELLTANDAAFAATVDAGVETPAGLARIDAEGRSDALSLALRAQRDGDAWRDGAPRVIRGRDTLLALATPSSALDLEERVSAAFHAALVAHDARAASLRRASSVAELIAANPAEPEA